MESDRDIAQAHLKRLADQALSRFDPDGSPEELMVEVQLALAEDEPGKAEAAIAAMSMTAERADPPGRFRAMLRRLRLVR